MNTTDTANQVAIYTRISKDSSDHQSQLLQLRQYCEKMGYEIVEEYSDTASGGSAYRAEFNRMMEDASRRRFDILLFYALDRFSRQGVRETISYLQTLDNYGVAYKSYAEQYIDSAGIFKDVIIALLSTLAKQERIRTGERVQAGLARARAQGRTGGRPTLDEDVIQEIRRLKSEGMSVVSISKKMKISRGSIYNYL